MIERSSVAGLWNAKTYYQPVLDRARAPHKGSAIEWVKGDVFDAPFAPGSFDAVVSVAALHHMDAAASLARFARLIRPGGTIAIVGLAANAWSDLPLAALGMTLRQTLDWFAGSGTTRRPRAGRHR